MDDRVDIEPVLREIIQVIDRAPSGWIDPADAEALREIREVTGKHLLKKIRG